MLGMFLLIQLSIVGGDWLRRSVLPALAMSMRSRVADPSFTPSGSFIPAIPILYTNFLMWFSIKPSQLLLMPVFY